MANIQYIGSLRSPGQKPQNVDMVLNAVPQLTEAEKAAGIEWVDGRYEPLNVLRYGADPTGATDSLAAFNSAVSVAETIVTEDTLNTLYGGGEVYIPAGRYQISGPVIWTKRGLVFRGDGRSTVIFAGSSFTANRAIFQSRERSDRSISGTSINVVFRDMAIYGDDPDSENFASPYTSSVRGIWITGLDGFNGPCGFWNLHFRGLSEDIMLAGAWRFTVADCAFVGGRTSNRLGTGLSFADANLTDAEDYSASGGTYSINAVTITGNRFQYLAHAMRWNAGAGGIWHGNTLESNTTEFGIVRLWDVRGVSFAGGYHEANIGPCFTLGGTSSANRVRNCEFSGNFFTTRSAGSNTSDFYLQNLEECRIAVNQHSGATPGTDVISASSSFTCDRSEIWYDTITENTTIDRDENIVRDYANNVPDAVYSLNRYPENNPGASNYTLVLSDAGKRLRHTSAIAHSWTIPPGADVAFENGATIKGVNIGSGTVTLTRGTGVALNYANGSSVVDQNVSVPQGAWFEISKVSANAWDCIGQGTS